MSYEYKEVVEKIRGLNSVSTLKKWRKKTEDLAGISFQEGITGIRGSYHARVPLFSEGDIEKFQQVADTKAELGLDNAILCAFTSEREPPKPISERMEQLEFFFMDLAEETRGQLKHLSQEINNLKTRVTRLEKRLEKLEEQSKPKSFFRKKN